MLLAEPKVNVHEKCSFMSRLTRKYRDRVGRAHVQVLHPCHLRRRLVDEPVKKEVRQKAQLEGVGGLGTSRVHLRPAVREREEPVLKHFRQGRGIP